MEIYSVYCNELVIYSLILNKIIVIQTMNPESVLLVLFLLSVEFNKWELKMRKEVVKALVKIMPFK